MIDPLTPQAAADTAFNAGTDVIRAAADVATAQELARAADSDALVAKIEQKMHEHAKENTEIMAESITKIVSDALGRVKSRYVDTDRIPLLCQTMFGMKDDIKELKDMVAANKEDSDKQLKNFVTKDGQYFIVRAIVFVGSGTILLAYLNSILNK